MCLIAILYRRFADAPVIVAANREEFFQRPSRPPHLLPQASGEQTAPRVMCGLDLLAGGTWLGINQRGLLIAVTNRPRMHVPTTPRSRGLLCLELLQQPSAASAAQLATNEVTTGRYNGGNFVCLDAESGHVVQAHDEIRVLPLEPGLHLITNGELNDPYDPRLRFARRQFEQSAYDSAAGFLDVAARVCAIHGDMGTLETVVLRGPDRGTVSSSLIALRQPPEQSSYLFANGPPDQTPYTDLSDIARELFSAPSSD